VVGGSTVGGGESSPHLLEECERHATAECLVCHAQIRDALGNEYVVQCPLQAVRHPAVTAPTPPAPPHTLRERVLQRRRELRWSRRLPTFSQCPPAVNLRKLAVMDASVDTPPLLFEDHPAPTLTQGFGHGDGRTRSTGGGGSAHMSTVASFSKMRRAIVLAFVLLLALRALRVSHSKCPSGGHSARLQLPA
jgi:hypothetical protein